MDLIIILNIINEKDDVAKLHAKIKFTDSAWIK